MRFGTSDGFQFHHRSDAGAGVRQSAKRQRIPDILDVDEMKRLLTELQQPVLAMISLDGATGLRRSELLGLKWSDIDFEKLEINLNPQLFAKSLVS